MPATKCQNNQCPLKDKCHRFMAQTSYKQLYARFLPEMENGEIVCENFIEMKRKDKDNAVQ